MSSWSACVADALAVRMAHLKCLGNESNNVGWSPGSSLRLACKLIIGFVVLFFVG